MQTVGVLHRELLRAEQSTAGVVVTVFAADLVTKDRQVLVRAHQPRKQVDHTLLV
ncbi:MAG: hypothetical protein J07HX64_02615 [halophilic archaeon J07HX64]|nr:MAG: hypothetical protein J07HX64_02615 [halophilic archaeon J07HX64]